MDNRISQWGRALHRTSRASSSVMLHMLPALLMPIRPRGASMRQNRTSRTLRGFVRFWAADLCFAAMAVAAFARTPRPRQRPAKTIFGIILSGIGRARSGGFGLSTRAHSKPIRRAASKPACVPLRRIDGWPGGAGRNSSKQLNEGCRCRNLAFEFELNHVKSNLYGRIRPKTSLSGSRLGSVNWAL